MQHTAKVTMRLTRCCTKRRCCIVSGKRESGSIGLRIQVRNVPHHRCTVVARSMEGVLDTEETPPELDESTIKQLMDLGTLPIMQKSVHCVDLGGLFGGCV